MASRGFHDVLPEGTTLTLNASYFYSVPPDVFRKHRETHFKYYPSPDEVCLWTRLMRHPLSMRGILREFLDHEYWTVRNPVPESGDPDGDPHGVLGYAYDHFILSTELDDEVLFLFSVFSTLCRCAPLRQAFFACSNPIALRCGMAFVHFGVHMVQTNCISTDNARHIVTSFVNQVRAMVTLGISHAALGIPYIFSHAHWAEEMVHTSNPLRFASDVDLPPRYYMLAPYLMTCPYYLTPYRIENAQGAAALKKALRLPASTVISPPNMGASCPPLGATPLETNKKHAEIMSSFFPEIVLLDVTRAASYMNLATLLMFYRIWLMSGFREVDKKAASRANRAIQRSLKREAAIKKQRQGKAAASAAGKASARAAADPGTEEEEAEDAAGLTDEQLLAQYYAEGEDGDGDGPVEDAGPDDSEDEEDEEAYDDVHAENDIED